MNRCLATVVLACTCALSAMAGIQEAKPLRIVESGPAGWTIDYTHIPPPQSTILIDGTLHTLFIGSPNDPDRAGEPLLPVETVTLGIPRGSFLEATLVDPVYESVPDQNIAPVPAHRFTDEGEALEEYVKSIAAYRQDRFYPAEQLIVEQPFALRQQRLDVIRLFPYQYNPATRMFRKLISARIVVRLMGSSKMPSAPSGAGDRHFESVYKGLIENYDEARQWRASTRSPESTGPDPTRDWFETGRTYYKIPIAIDGWYRVTKSDLAAAGADPLTVAPATLKLFHRGVQVPIVVRADTSVEFFGRRNYGDTTFIDFYADTNAYWLTWGGVAGIRYIPRSQHPDAPVQTIVSAQFSNHYEENTGYYQGTTQLEVIQNGMIPGEGWYWERLFPNTTITKTFTLGAVDSTGAESEVRARLFSMTAAGPGPDPDHQARFWINDSLLGDITFEGRAGVTFVSTFPTAWLKGDTNRLRVTSLPTATIPNLFYLDWFNLHHRRYLKATYDLLEFTSPSSSGAGPSQFVVSGFTTPTIEVFDVSGRMITGGVISGDSSSGFSVAFKDTFSSPRTYLVVGGGAASPVLPLRQKQFMDIRVNPTGADYIIITHNKFQAPAQQLAQHRVSQNGVRVALVDVEDIYDEFNYGIFDATKLKTFLWHAYQAWTSPAPSSVLLFGDASWDFEQYLSSSIKANYVPAYGVPAGDNWFVAFDTTVVPWMNVGRIPVEDSIQAARTVAKIIGYDNYELEEWNKNFLMITGGNSPSEQSIFNSNTENLINSYILPPPVGGTPFRVYKATDAVIDGENRQYMRERVREGLVFVNFLGHSGGRIWGVDIGNPHDLENTNGRLPFVSTVSCNVGAFAEPASNVLAEDFVMADNRGGIASWASSSLGYPTPGTLLVNHFLSAVRDSVRDFGALTTYARVRLWQTAPGNAIYQAMVNLNPLIGDPLSRLAIPLKPDLAISSSDISVTQPVPTPNDSLLTVKVKVRNNGLVPADSVELSLTDLHNGKSFPVLNRRKIPPTRHHDSLLVVWDASGQVGFHTLTAALDPWNLIDEVNEFNNAASATQYVYANVLAIVKPIVNQVVPLGFTTLVVTSPVGRDSSGYHYYFELDTVPTFDSPFKVVSGPVPPGVVKGEWTTPALQDGAAFFWRARTVEGDLEGNWVTSTFSTSTSVPSSPVVRWRQYTSGQFERNTFVQAVATDSGVTIEPDPPLNLYARSLGNRADPNLDYYSIIKLNELTIAGYWWVLGNSFMVLRVSESTGAYEFKGFDVAGQSSQGDSLRSFINNTPEGNYVVMSVIFDGKTNVNESLYVALESLGSTTVRNLLPGQSWAFIGRKGFPSAALESLTEDSAIVGLQVPNYYSIGTGSMTSERIPNVASWDSLQWAWSGPSGSSEARVGVLGVRADGSSDTLRIFSSTETSADLAFLNPLTSGRTYTSFRVAGLLSSLDASVTPSIQAWWLDFRLPADLAISSQTVGQEATIERGAVFDLPVTVHNIGFKNADSASLIVSVYDIFNRTRTIAQTTVGAIPVNGSQSTTIPIHTSDFPRRTTIQVNVHPTGEEKDLVPENNHASFNLNIVGGLNTTVRVFADGVQLMDGDYVSPRPRVLVQIPQREGYDAPVRRVELFVDGTSAGGATHRRLRGDGTVTQEQGTEYVLTLQDGRRELAVRAIEATRFGDLDTLEHKVYVNVMTETRVLQVFNYPNPFSTETHFTFVLTGAAPTDDVVIRVFTVSGRKIREITVPASTLQIGFNKVWWDGRDSDGDDIANGYYFYQLTTKKEGGGVLTSIERLVKLR